MRVHLSKFYINCNYKWWFRFNRKGCGVSIGLLISSLFTQRGVMKLAQPIRIIRNCSPAGLGSVVAAPVSLASASEAANVPG